MKRLLEKTRERYQNLHPNDPRWPCPFCLHKANTLVQCKIHITKDHRILTKKDIHDTLQSQLSSIDENETTKNFSQDDLKEFLKLVENDNNDPSSMNEVHFQDTKSESKCTRCGFKAKNIRGLNIHSHTCNKKTQSSFESESQETTPNNVINEENQSIPNTRIQCPHSPNRTFVNKKNLQKHLEKKHSESSTFEEITDFQERLARCKEQLKVVNRIPRGARNSVASKMTNVINKCVETNSFDSWKELSFFTYNVLHVKDKSGDNKKKRSLTSEIKKNTLKPSNLMPQINPELRKNNFSSNVKYVEARIGDGDIRGSIRILSSEDTIAPGNLDTLLKLRDKHPDAPSTFIPPEPLNDFEKSESLVADKEDVRNGIFSFVTGSSGGEDGIRPQHLKDLISRNNGEMGEQLLSSVTNLSNLMLAGEVNEEFVPFFYGATLIALYKKDGGIRPIAVGATFRRLVAKLGCGYMKENLLRDFMPRQMGFGVKGGCEAAVHAVRTFLKDPDFEIIVKIDVKNAFNSAARDAMLHKVKSSIPALYPFFHQCYAQETYLCFADDIILSKTGCQQGDPAGPGLFSLVINESIKSLQSILNVWYLDDGTLGGSAETVMSDIVRIITEFGKLGLSLNSAKCEIFFNKSMNEVRKNEISEKLNRTLPGIKVMTEETFKFKSILHTFDESIKSSLENILNIRFSKEKWDECTLPVKNGGLGVRTTTDTCIPAFISSSYSTLHLVGNILSQSSIDFEISCLEEAIIAWKDLCPEHILPTTQSIQKCWDTPIINLKHLTILANASSVAERARLLAVQRPESGAWINALPSPQLGLLLDPATIRISVGIRLGLPICEEHKCICGSVVDTTGRHGLSCLKITGRYSRHHGMNDIIKRSLGTGGFPAILEPPGLTRTDGKRPDGLTLIPWQKGRSLVWDATCVDTFAKSYLISTSKVTGAAAKLAERQKFQDYEPLCRNYEFVPFAVETMGVFSDSALKFTNELGKFLSLATDDRRAKSFFLQRISICIQRGNSASILATLPSSAADKFNEVFYL